MLASSFAGKREATVATSRSPGRSRRKPLKPLRAGMPGESGEPVVTTSCAHFLFRTRDCGCIKHPAFPTPFLGRKLCTTRAHLRRESAELCMGFHRRHCDRPGAHSRERWLGMTAREPCTSWLFEIEQAFVSLAHSFATRATVPHLLLQDDPRRGVVAGAFFGSYLAVDAGLDQARRYCRAE
jgi:hypothetical protein